MEQSEWGSGKGRGITVGKTTYCCEGCFTASGCVCADIKQHAFAVSRADSDLEEGRPWPSEGSPD